jgi:iron(III) transport system ATP-binding protein
VTLSTNGSSALRGTIRKAAYLGTHMEYTVEAPIGSLFVVDRNVSRPMAAGTDVSISLADHGVALVPG